MIQQTIFSFKMETTKERLTAHGGLALMAEFNHGIGLRELADQYLPGPGSNRGFEPSEVVDAVVLMLEGGGRSLEDLRELDAIRHPALLCGLAAAGRVADWADLVLRVVDASAYTVGPLFRRRAESYGSKVLFEVAVPGGSRPMSWRQTAGRVEALARGLHATLADTGPVPRVAILSDNRIEMVLVDLACLTSGIVDVVIPGNSTELDVGYMLAHAGARAVVASDRQQLSKVLRNRESLPDLEHVIVMDPALANGREVVSLDEIAERAPRVSEGENCV